MSPSTSKDGEVRDDVDATEALRWALLRSASGDTLSALQSATTSGVSSSEGAVTADHEPHEPHEPGRGEGRAHLSTPGLAANQAACSNAAATTTGNVNVLK
jgi:hypothetical protein